MPGPRSGDGCRVALGSNRSAPERTASRARPPQRDTRGSSVAGARCLVSPTGRPVVRGDREPRIVVEPSEVRYAQSEDLHIAYQVLGEGERDLVLVEGFASHLDMEWDNPSQARFFR